MKGNKEMFKEKVTGERCAPASNCYKGVGGEEIIGKIKRWESRVRQEDIGKESENNKTKIKMWHSRSFISINSTKLNVVQYLTKSTKLSGDWWTIGRPRRRSQEPVLRVRGSSASVRSLKQSRWWALL